MRFSSTLYLRFFFFYRQKKYSRFFWLWYIGGGGWDLCVVITAVCSL
jgi:hypothetical protein